MGEVHESRGYSRLILLFLVSVKAFRLQGSVDLSSFSLRYTPLASETEFRFEDPASSTSDREEEEDPAMSVVRREARRLQRACAARLNVKRL